jgi:DNA-binding transcriptional regulator YiaG
MVWNVEYTDEFGDWWSTLGEGEQDIMAKSFTELKEKMSPERREKIEDRARTLLVSMALQELRQKRQLTQQDLANILHVNQAALSKMENQSDMRVSTLRKLLAAMGGNLKIIAEFPEGEVVIDQFEKV